MGPPILYRATIDPHGRRQPAAMRPDAPHPASIPVRPTATRRGPWIPGTLAGVEIFDYLCWRDGGRRAC